MEIRFLGHACFELTEGGVPRQDYPILADGQRVGVVTSGNVSPSLGKPIGMGYVRSDLAEPGQSIAVEIRGRPVAARVVSLPFYQHRTRRAGQPAPAGA